MNSPDNYLQAKVQTASQAELNLMLNDGAVRFARQGLAAWERQDDAEADRLLDRALDALEALVQGCAAGGTDLSRRLEEEYAFCYRELAAGRINRDRQRVETTLELLDYERETWRLASERLTTPKSTPAVPAPAPLPVDAPSLSLEA